MSILFNKKIILKNLILIIVVAACFFVVMETASALGTGTGGTGPGTQTSGSNLKEVDESGRTSNTPVILKTGSGADEAKQYTAEQDRKELERQEQIQNSRREARSDFTPLNPIKGVTDAEAAESPSKFFNGMFMFGISIAAFLAVLMIAIGGIQYMSTDAVSGKSEGRERITYAVMGLLLVLFSWILLRQINPEILDFNFLDTPTSSYSNTGAFDSGGDQDGNRTSNNFTEYDEKDIYTYFDEQRGYSYKVVGEDKDGNEIRFYPDLQNDPNPEYTIQQPDFQSQQNDRLKNRAQQSIRRNGLEGFTESSETSIEGIMTDTQRLQKLVDEANEEISQ